MKKGLVDHISHGKPEILGDYTDNQDLCNWFEINGVTFNTNDVILFNIVENIPEYYIISKIICRAHTNEVLFNCFYLQIIKYNPHFRAYKVVRTSQNKIINYKDLYMNLYTFNYL